MLLLHAFGSTKLSVEIAVRMPKDLHVCVYMCIRIHTACCTFM